MLLSKNDILKARDFKLREVKVPQWGGSVMIKTLSSKDKGAFEQKTTTENLDLSKIMAEYASLIICDEDGNRLFSREDIDELSEKSASALELVFNEGRDLNNFTEEDLEALAGN